MIKTTASIQQSAKINALIYGDSGVGKTRLALTCDRPLVISAEGGLLSLAGHDVPYIEVNDIKSAREAVGYAIKHASEYGTIIFDSLSEIAEIVLADALQKTPDPRKAYPEAEAAVTRLIRQLRDLPCSVIWIGKSTVTQDDMGRRIHAPMVPGSKFQDKLPYLLDLVGRLVVDTVAKEDGTQQLRRTLRFVSDGSFTAKDRSGKLPELCPAHIGKIIERIGRSSE
jgi:hypothetical protein|nr:MAG TPA: AAA domain protein [Caudoviricetes sp.]